MNFAPQVYCIPPSKKKKKKEVYCIPTIFVVSTSKEHVNIILYCIITHHTCHLEKDTSMVQVESGGKAKPEVMATIKPHSSNRSSIMLLLTVWVIILK
jgi:hypothetical protein